MNNPFGQFPPCPEEIEAQLKIALATEQRLTLQALAVANTQHMSIRILGMSFNCSKPANAEVHEKLMNLGLEVVKNGTRQLAEKSDRSSLSKPSESNGMDGRSDNPLLEEAHPWIKTNNRERFES